MLFGKFIDQLGSRLGLQNPSDPVTRQTLGDKINESCKEVGISFDWQFLRAVADLLTIPNVTVTATVTQGSRTITGSGFDITMKGRYFQPYTGQNWYRIVDSPNSSTLTLEQPIQEASGTGASTIWKRFYYLRSEVSRVLQFYKWLGDGTIEDKGNRFYDTNSPNVSNPAVPNFNSLYGTDNFTTPYNTGTVSLTKDSQTMTGAGTAWLSNAGSGDIVILSATQDRGQIELRVKRVESDTSIILYQFAPSTETSVPYSIMIDAPLGIEFQPQADKAYIFPYMYVRKVFNMVNENNDRPPFPESFDQTILDGAEAQRLRDLNDQKWTTKWQEYTARLDNLKARQGRLSKPRYRQFRPFIPTRRSYGGGLHSPGVNGAFENPF